MIKHIYQLFCLLILAACTDNDLETTETQLITDSYFFQKQSLNFNIYECNQYQNYDFNNYRQSTSAQTFLKISVKPYLFENYPKPIYKLLFYLVVRPMLRNYLESVIGGIDWYLINKRPVPRNIFGKHLWFSNY